MRKLISLFLLSVSWLCVEAQTLNLSLHDASLDDVVASVQDQTDYTFVYGQNISFRRNVNVDIRNASLDECLKAIFGHTGISYRTTARHILLFRQQSNQGGAEHTVNGYVVDSESKETLIGSTVISLSDKHGAVTNAYGFFSITLPDGDVALRFSYMGYSAQIRSFSLASDTTIYVNLVSDNKLEEIVVEADRPETGFAATRTGAVSLPVEMIRQQPSLLGEPDVLKTLQTLPGVARGFAGSSAVHVRGGSADQNLYLLDGVPLYNVDHVLGFFSAFTPDAVKRVDFYKGAFPSRYGGRLSSVIDVRTKDGDMHNYHGMFSIGLLSSHASFEGPIADNKTSFIVSARRSYVDLFLIPINKASSDDTEEQKTRLSFYDINAKVNHIFSENDRLFASFYMGRDALRVRDEFVSSFSSSGPNNVDVYDTKARWGNTFGALRWNHIFSPQTFGNVTVAYNRFNFNIRLSDNGWNQNYKSELNTNMNTTLKSGINDLTAIADIDFHPSPQHRLKAGMQYTLHCFRPEMISYRYSEQAEYSNSSDNSSYSDSYSVSNGRILGNESALYVDDDMLLTDELRACAGLRATLFAVEGRLYANAEPRISLSYDINDVLKAKGSYSMMHQYVHLLTTSQLSMPSDLWVPITKNIKPQLSNTWSSGLYSDVIPSLELSIEAYYKKMDHILDYKDGMGFVGGSQGWENIVSSGSGRSRGVELMARRVQGKTKGSASYTLSKTDRKFDHSVNAGRRFPFKYDRRHVFNIVVQHSFSSKIDASVSWNYASGSWITLAKQRSVFVDIPTNDYVSDETEFDCYVSRNNYHLAPTHQMDVNVNFHKQRQHYLRTWSISIINAYNHMNQDLVYSRRQEYEVDGQICYKNQLRRVTIIPIMPSVTYSLKF